MKVAIAAGGTGGHLFPAEALARALEARGHSVALFTDRRTAERAGGRFGTVSVVGGAGLAGKSAAARVTGAAALLRGAATAWRQLDADAVVGFGGYPSVPAVLAARFRRPRPAIVLHDQNAVLGSANRVLARFADAVATSFPRVAGVPPRVRTECVGNPVRASIEAVAPYRLPSPPYRLLVLGGSLGARVFSDVVPEAVRRSGLPIAVVQQARAEDVTRVEAAYAAAGIAAEVATFFHDVDARLAAADLVIARSGGSTVAELAAAGRPSVLVPLPIAASDEQTANALTLTAAGAAWMVKQPDLASAPLAEMLQALFADRDRLVSAADAARRAGRRGVAEKMASLVEELATTHYAADASIRHRTTRTGA